LRDSFGNNLRPLLRERLFRHSVPIQEEELVMKLRGLFIAAAVLLMPGAALAAPGIVTTTASLRAGPGEGFPTVDRIPGGFQRRLGLLLRIGTMADPDLRTGFNRSDE
jgi:hypothetical protein